MESLCCIPTNNSYVTEESPETNTERSSGPCHYTEHGNRPEEGSIRNRPSNVPLSNVTAGNSCKSKERASSEDTLLGRNPSEDTTKVTCDNYATPTLHHSHHNEKHHEPDTYFHPAKVPKKCRHAAVHSFGMNDTCRHVSDCTENATTLDKTPKTLKDPELVEHPKDRPGTTNNEDLEA